MSVEISAQVAQNGVAELIDRLVAEHRFREPDTTRLKPILPTPRSFRAKDQKADDSGQAKSEQARDDAAEDRPPIGVSDFREPLGAQIDLFALHRCDLVADGVHVLFAAIGLHLGERRGLALTLAEIDRVLELGELGPNVLSQASEAVLLRGIVERQPLQRIEARPNFQYSRVVWIEVTVLIGEQIASLASFRVFDGGKHILQGGQRVTAADNESAVLFQSLKIEISDCAARHEEEGGGGEAQPDQRIPARPERRRTGHRALSFHPSGAAFAQVLPQTAAQRARYERFDVGSRGDLGHRSSARPHERRPKAPAHPRSFPRPMDAAITRASRIWAPPPINFGSVSTKDHASTTKAWGANLLGPPTKQGRPTVSAAVTELILALGSLGLDSHKSYYGTYAGAKAPGFVGCGHSALRPG